MNGVVDLRILIVTGCFPPTNVIGAVRTGKMAKYLLLEGHEVKVLTPDRQSPTDSLSLEVPASAIIRTKWLDSDKLVKVVLGKDIDQKAKQAMLRNSELGRKTSKRLTLSYFSRIYQALVRFPDKYIGWYPWAISAGKRLLKDWKPDIIYASAVPYTSLLVAKKLSQQFGTPWVAELRDLWVDNHYREYGPLRNWLDAKMEKRTLETASGLVTVSEPLAEKLRSKYSQPCVVVPNGFDPDDYDNEMKPEEGSLRIVYTGSFYQGKRDPSSLFKALHLLGENKDSVNVHFYGPSLGIAVDLAKKFGCEGNVEVHAPVSHKESLRSQQKADILLLLLWNDPSEKGVFTGKLFEYLGARRPILAIGPSDNVAAQTIIERGAGVVSNEPETIADYLKMWIEKKQKGIPIESPPEEATKGFTREEQANKLAEFLEQVLEESRNKK